MPYRHFHHKTDSDSNQISTINTTGGNSRIASSLLNRHNFFWRLRLSDHGRLRWTPTGIRCWWQTYAVVVTSGRHRALAIFSSLAGEGAEARQVSEACDDLEELVRDCKQISGTCDDVQTRVMGRRQIPQMLVVATLAGSDVGDLKRVQWPSGTGTK